MAVELDLNEPGSGQAGHVLTDRGAAPVAAIQDDGGEDDGGAKSPPKADAHELRSADESIVDIVAAKLLVDWLRNRHQVLLPFTIDLQRLAQPLLESVLHAMIAAARAQGPADVDRERLIGALELLKGTSEHRALLEQALERPRPLADALGPVTDVECGAIVYAASLLAIDRRKPVNRHYLRYLATRLDLPPQLTTSIERRFAIAS